MGQRVSTEGSDLMSNLGGTHYIRQGYLTI